MLFENPYFVFPFKVNTTQMKIFSGGFRGNFSSQMSFNFRLNYSDVSDMYFYVNDTSFKESENRFTIVYDDVQLMNLLGELSYKHTEKLNFLLKANYYSYYLDKIAKPWHKPDYEISFNTRYNLKNKILLDANIFAIGKRYVQEYNPIESIEELDAIIDINLGLEYKYSKILSGFIRLNNIGASKYYKWNYYPSQSFNMMLGVTYSL